jgi:hypothetical protein
LEFESLSQLLGETRKFLRTGKRAEDYKDLLPVLKIGILNDIREIVGNNGLE